MKQVYNTIAPLTQASLQGQGMHKNIMMCSYHYNCAMMDDNEHPKDFNTSLSPPKINKQGPNTHNWYQEVMD